MTKYRSNKEGTVVGSVVDVSGLGATDAINHPAHYNSHPSGIECINVVRWMNFNRGNAIKYIWRADDKGNPVEDLKKAIWYLQDEIKRLEGGS